MKLSEAASLISAHVAAHPEFDIDLDGPASVPAPEHVGPPVHDAAGYEAYMELGYYEDGKTQFASVQDVQARKALCIVHSDDPSVQGVDPRVLRLSVVTGRERLLPDRLLPASSFDHLKGKSLDDYVAELEARKHSGGTASG